MLAAACTALACILVAEPPARPPSFSVTSPNNRFELHVHTLTLAEVAHDVPSPFASDTYARVSLTGHTDDGPVSRWTDNLPLSTFHVPRRAAVRNDGTSVILCYDTLILLSPTGGVSAVHDIQIPEDQRRTYLGRTSPSLFEGLLVYFHKESVCIRTYWGLRLVAAVNGTEALRPPSKPEIELLRAAELAIAVQTIRESIAEPDEHSLSKPTPTSQLLGALMVIHEQGVNENVSDLQELQSADNQKLTGMRLGGCRDHIVHFHAYPVRQLTQLTLRRLGSLHQRVPSHVLVHHEPRIMHPPKGEEDADIQPDMAPEAVYQAIGGPDWIMPEQSAWDYDFLTMPGQTLRIVWNDQGLVECVDHIELTPEIERSRSTSLFRADH